MIPVGKWTNKLVGLSLKNADGIFYLLLKYTSHEEQSKDSRGSVFFGKSVKFEYS